jgi:hypothetical protein
MCLAFLLSSGLGAVAVVGMYLELSHVSLPLPFLFIAVFQPRQPRRKFLNTKDSVNGGVVNREEKL